MMQLCDFFGSLEEAWSASKVGLEAAGITANQADQIIREREKIELEFEFDRMNEKGVICLCLADERYPRHLKEIAQPPPVLYLLGSLDQRDYWRLGVVGTRNHTYYGRQVTQKLVAELVTQGMIIVSGLARGIDTIAHQSALQGGGQTIAVLGSGLDHIYPVENKKLVQQILEDEGGAIISEYPLGVKPDPRNFPPRNRIISGLSVGVLVVEAADRSGALITANFALEQGRELFAVPGNIFNQVSRGPHKLIQDGAKLVRSVHDILDELHIKDSKRPLPAVQLRLPESTAEAVLVGHLTHEPIHINELIRETGLPSSEVSSTLTLMELKGVVQTVGKMYYILALHL